MNYEEMSDFQINKAVAGKWFSKCDWVVVKSWSEGELVASLVDHTQEKFDPCSNPSDAWAIILGCNITIEISFDCMFEAYSFVNGKRYSCTFDEKELALRAAMICFLKMKDA